MPKRMKATETDRLRTVYMSVEDRETLHSVAEVQEIHASTIARQIFADFLSGKLKVTTPPPHKTSLLVEDQMWEDVMKKCREEGVSIRKVLAAGIARLRGRR